MAHLPHRIVTMVFALVSALVLATACTSDEPAVDPDPGGGGDGSQNQAVGNEASSDVEDAPPEPPPCSRNGPGTDPRVELTGDDVTALAIRVADVTHRCAPVVVIAPGGDAWAATLAAPVARSVDGPLLLSSAEGDDALTSALSALDTEKLVTVGDVTASTTLTRTRLEPPDDVGDEVVDEWLARMQLALRVAEELDTDRFLAVDADDEDTRGAALARLEDDLAILPLPPDELTMVSEQLPSSARVEVLAATDTEARRLADELIAVGVDAQPVTFDGSAWPPGGTSTWLVDPSDGAITAVGAVAARGGGGSLLPIDGDDPRSGRDRTARIREAGSERHVLLGRMGPDAAWQLETVLEGQPLPWGGFRLFEDERMVALYGSVEAEALGALGEQGLEATIERLRTVAEPYGADGARVRPTLELITTIASASAGPTGDYSRRTPIELLRPWVERAAEEELYVVLDLQPGRTDFLTQAQEYEELLREPHVGLALDPEWRLGPDELHLRQIGSVDAAEVQQVADWLAELTREHLLPEKLLVLHQFRYSMLPDRESIVAPPELSVVVHMDGQGPLGTKYDTYAAITRDVEERWLWGWKNFYDEDHPTPTPEQVLGLDPRPVFVSYQ